MEHKKFVRLVESLVLPYGAIQKRVQIVEEHKRMEEAIALAERRNDELIDILREWASENENWPDGERMLVDITRRVIKVHDRERE